jgi:aspartate racemase
MRPFTAYEVWMHQKIIGVLGGMGPEATLDFYRKLIANTPARTDQDHLRVIIDSNPKIPDRIRPILFGGVSPVPEMAASTLALERAGADFIVMPCISAHFFLEELRTRCALPIISILDVIAEQIEATHSQVNKIGLLATLGAIRAGQIQERLGRDGRATIVPEPDDQQIVIDAIRSIKDNQCGLTREQIGIDVRRVSTRLIDRGAEAVVMACTELPLVMGPGDLPVPVFDPLDLLARAAIRAAGSEPKIG